MSRSQVSDDTIRCRRDSPVEPMPAPSSRVAARGDRKPRPPPARADLCLRLADRIGDRPRRVHAPCRRPHRRLERRRRNACSATAPPTILQQPVGVAVCARGAGGQPARPHARRGDACRRRHQHRLVPSPRRRAFSRPRRNPRCRADPAGALLGFACVAARPERRARTRSPARRRGGADAGAPAGDAASTAFLSMISHEIRTPLTGIKGFTEALALQDLSPLQRRYVDLASASCAALMTVVDDLLDFSAHGRRAISSSSRSRSRWRRWPTTPCRWCSATPRPRAWRCPEHRARRAAVARRRSQSRAPDPAQPARQRGQVHAARQRSACRSPASRAAGGGETLKFAVIDTGIGIPEDRLSRLFNRFSQADAIDPRPLRRHRARARHLQATGRAHGRRDRRRDGARSRLDLLVHRPARPRRGGAGGAAGAAARRGAVARTSASFWSTTAA